MVEQSAVQWFSDPADAGRYLAEVARLWAAWVVTLALLFLFQEWWSVMAVGIGFLVAMVVLGRPLQARAARVPDGDRLVGSRIDTALGRGRAKDDAFRRLLYGEGPLREALALTGRSAVWLWVRRLLVVTTVAAFIWVLLSIFADSP